MASLGRESWHAQRVKFQPADHHEQRGLENGEDGNVQIVQERYSMDFPDLSINLVDKVAA